MAPRCLYTPLSRRRSVVPAHKAFQAPWTGTVPRREQSGLQRQLVPQRGLAARLGWLLRDYAKRVWDNSGEDNVFFLAGGISFNILLAAVPLFLLLATGLVFLPDQFPPTTSAGGLPD